jgi:hypothetical protein
VATENLPSSSAPTTAAVSLFQKAHGRMTTLQRIDEQVAALNDQRKKIQEELRAVQGLINEEFDRVVKGGPIETANRMLSHLSDSGAPKSSGNGAFSHSSQSEIEEAVA